eukprot:GFUD01002869.1.p1 GENE.GFUD01002869.1~~GFUD01002869.1.p1  ORF type:complete len:222 (-),score=56.68 GFUD01002869.1:111-710(-)
MGIQFNNEVDTLENVDNIHNARHKADTERFCSRSERMKIFESFCKKESQETNTKTISSVSWNMQQYKTDSENRCERYLDRHQYTEDLYATYSRDGYIDTPKDSGHNYRYESEDFQREAIRDLKERRGVEVRDRNLRTPSSRSIAHRNKKVTKHRMVADREEEQIKRKPSEQEDGEVSESDDDDFDNILTGCRTANWNLW